MDNITSVPLCALCGEKNLTTEDTEIHGGKVRYKIMEMK